MRILVGVDGAEGGRDALALARDLRGAAGSIVAAHVDTAARADAERLLRGERTAAGVESAELAVSGADSVGAGLHELAVDVGADLVVVGTSRRHGLARFLVGDDARATIREAGSPVAVAPRGYGGATHAIRTIGVGFDETGEAAAALALARALAEVHGASVTVVEAVEVASWLIDPMVAPTITKDAEERRREAEQRLAALTGVEAHATTGLALQEMKSLAEHVDLLVVGWHPRGPVARLMEGSTGESLSNDPACPVIVVPPPRRDSMT